MHGALPLVTQTMLAIGPISRVKLAILSRLPCYPLCSPCPRSPASPRPALPCHAHPTCGWKRQPLGVSKASLCFPGGLVPQSTSRFLYSLGPIVPRHGGGMSPRGRGDAPTWYPGIDGRSERDAGTIRGTRSHGVVGWQCQKTHTSDKHQRVTVSKAAGVPSESEAVDRRENHY